MYQNIIIYRFYPQKARISKLSIKSWMRLIFNLYWVQIEMGYQKVQPRNSTEFRNSNNTWPSPTIWVTR